MHISIIIPTFNRANVIPRTLDSILSQTHIDWDCIVVDDSSTDNTVEVISEYAQKDKRISYLTNSRKKGAQGARNTGLYSTSSDWVFFFDSDNILHSKCLERLVSRIIDGIDVVQCFSQIVDVNTGATGKKFSWINHGCIHDAILCGETYVDFNHAIIRREKLLQIGGLDEDCPCMQEWDTHIRLSTIARYETVEEVLVDYYVGALDAISSNPIRDVRGKLSIFCKYNRELRKHPYRYRRNVAYLLSIIKQLNDKEVQKQFYNTLKEHSTWDSLIFARVFNFLIAIKLCITKNGNIQGCPRTQ